jgi:hypothetical protein
MQLEEIPLHLMARQAQTLLDIVLHCKKVDFLSTQTLIRLDRLEVQLALLASKQIAIMLELLAKMLLWEQGYTRRQAATLQALDFIVDPFRQVLPTFY